MPCNTHTNLALFLVFVQPRVKTVTDTTLPDAIIQFLVFPCACRLNHGALWVTFVQMQDVSIEVFVIRVNISRLHNGNLTAIIILIFLFFLGFFLYLSITFPNIAVFVVDKLKFSHMFATRC